MADEFDLDLDASVTEPKGFLVFKGERHAVLSIVDVPSGDATQIMELDEDVKDKGLGEQILVMRRTAQLLVPSLTDPLLALMTLRQMLQVTAAALGTLPADVLAAAA